MIWVIFITIWGSNFCPSGNTEIALRNFITKIECYVAGCDIYAVVGTYSGIGSAFCNAIIAYDRYRVIVHPFSKSGMSITKAICILAVIYLYITPFAILPALGIWSRFVPEGFLTSCAADFFTQDFNGRSYIVGTWFFGWLIPVIAIIFFYVQIFLAVKDHEEKIKEQVRFPSYLIRERSHPS